MRFTKLKTCLICALSLATASACSPEKVAGVRAEPINRRIVTETNRDARSPLETVNLRMEAYNNHDIEGFVSLYADDVAIYTYPDIQLGQGIIHLRSIFEPMFEEQSVSVEIHHQISKDGFVINHETVHYGVHDTEYVSIYEVRQGLITSVRFVRDTNPSLH